MILEGQYLRRIDDQILILGEISITLVRNQVREVAHEARLSSETSNNVALVATELTQIQLLHAKFGQIVVRQVTQFGVPGIEATAADLGRGIEDPAKALREEVSTSGSLGAGLSLVYRLAQELDFDIRLGEGTCIWARRFEKAPKLPFAVNWPSWEGPVPVRRSSVSLMVWGIAYLPMRLPSRRFSLSAKDRVTHWIPCSSNAMSIFENPEAWL